MEMKKYLFKELVVDSRTGLNPRKNFKLGHGNNYYITIKDIHDGEVVITDKTEHIDDDALKIINKRSRLKAGDVLFSSIGRIGETAIIKEEPKNWNINESVFAFTTNKELITPDFFRWMFKAPKYKNEIMRESTGSTFVSIKMNKLNEMEFEIPLRLADQKEIVEELETISSAIANSDKRIASINESIQSRFYEMFGDINENTKNFPICRFGDYVKQMNIGPFGSDLKNEVFVSKDDGYIMVYEQKHAIEKRIDWEPRYITKTKFEKMKRFEIGPGDIIVSCRGTIGECFLLPENAPQGIIHPSLMMIKIKESVNNKFLLYVLERILSLQKSVGAAVQMAIKATELAEIETIRPSREMQDAFVEFVDKLEKMKGIVLKEKENLVEILNSKIDYYFGI